MVRFSADAPEDCALIVKPSRTRAKGEVATLFTVTGTARSRAAMVPVPARMAGF